MENNVKQKVETWMVNLVVQTGISKKTEKNWKSLPKLDGEIKPVVPFQR